MRKIAAILMLAACGSMTTVKTAAKAAAACARADLGQVVTQTGDTLIQYVAQLITKSDGKSLSTYLDEVAGLVGAEAVVCAIYAYNAALHPDPNVSGRETGNLPIAKAWAAARGAQL